MAKQGQVRTIRVSEAAARAVLSGHPWVYREGMPVISAGEPVAIQSSRGRVVGWGLADEGAIAIRVLGSGDGAPVPSRVVSPTGSPVLMVGGRECLVQTRRPTA